MCDVKIFIIADSARVTFALLNEKSSVEFHRSYVRFFVILEIDRQNSMNCSTADSPNVK